MRVLAAAVFACLFVLVLPAATDCMGEGLSASSDSSSVLLIEAPDDLDEGGGSFAVSVSVSNVDRLVAYQIELDFYDNAIPTEAFTVTGSEEGKLFDGKDVLARDLPTGRASILTAGYVSGSGTLAGFTVSYPPKLHGEYYIWLRAELVDCEAQKIAYTCTPVPVRIGKEVSPTLPPTEGAGTKTLIPVPAGPIYCDVNGDGNVNLLDLVLVRNMSGITADPEDLFHDRRRYADVSDPADGAINNVDLNAVSGQLGENTPYAAEDFAYSRVTEYPLVEGETEWADDTWLVRTEGGSIYAGCDPWTYCPAPLVLEVTCEITPAVPVVGGLTWRVTEGSIVATSFDTQTMAASAAVLVAADTFTVTVYNRGIAIGSTTIELTPVFPDVASREWVEVSDQSKALDRMNNEYWGVFGVPYESLEAEIVYHNGGAMPYSVRLYVLWSQLQDVQITGPGQQVTIGGGVRIDFQAPPGDAYFDVSMDLPQDASESVASGYLKAEFADYTPDILRYTVVTIEDTTALKLLPWLGWENMFDQYSHEPQQSNTLTVKPTPADGLVRIAVEVFEGLTLFDGYFEEVFAQPDGVYWVPGDACWDVEDDCFSAHAFSSVESTSANDKTINFQYHNPYGYYDAFNPVNAVTENYTVVRPDIDIDTDRSGTIVASGENEQADDEMEWEKGICAHVGAAIELRTPLVVRITPFDQTIGGTITLEKSGSGKVRVRDTYGWQHLGENDTSADLTAYLFAIENYNLRIEGVEAGEVELKLTYTNGGFTTYDRVRLFLGPDLDIDSDNDNGYDPPDQDYAEDLREDIAGYPQYPGKITVVNDGDIDADGIPDFADGYNRDGTASNDDDSCTGLQFVPVVLKISKPEKASIESAIFTITYNSSDPANVTEVGGVYTITDAGILRLWKDDGPSREMNPANAVQDPGDFIPGSGGEEYTAAQLGFTEYNLSQPFFVEAVRPSSTVADQQIKVEVDWDGEGVQWPTTEDAVRVTIQQLSVDGLRVYDPKLDDTPLANIDYRIDSPDTSYSPQIELTILDAAGDVACLIRKENATLRTDLAVNWDGKWGVDKDGNPIIPNEGLYADPAEYTVEANLYLRPDDPTALFTKNYSLYVVRLGVEEITFLNDVQLQYPFRCVADWTTNTPGLSTAGEQYAIPDIAWRIGDHNAAAQGDTNLDSTEAGDYGNRHEQEDPRGEHSTTSTVQAVVDELYWPASEPGGVVVEDDSYNYPVCYVFTQRVEMDVTIGERAASQVLHRVLQSNELGYQYPCAHEINVNEVTSKFHAVGGDVDVDFEDRGTSFEDIAPGGTIQLRASHNLSDTVGKEVIQIEFAFNYTRAGENVAIPGIVRTSHVIYRVPDTPNTPQAVPWVCVLDKAVQWAAGADSVPAVQTAMEAALNGASGWKAGQEMPLMYDAAGGRSNYSNWGVNLRLGNFMMFLHRTRSACAEALRSFPTHPDDPPVMTENMVNCSDCGALLPAFANAVGGDLRTSFLYTVNPAPPPPSLGFELNPIRPVGFDEWTAILFAQEGGFSFHAVATEGGSALNGATRVYDSCLRLGSPDPTQFVNGAIVSAGASRLSNGSTFDATGSVTFALTAQPGAGKGSLNGRPSNTPDMPDPGAQAERDGVSATYTATLTGAATYDVTRQWTAPAGTQHSSAQGVALNVRVPPAIPGAATDCTTTDACAQFEIVAGPNPFVAADAFVFTSAFDYDGEYRGALAAPGPEGRGRCNWQRTPLVPVLE